MRLTIARYYTPSGRSIQAKGIEPDIVVKQSKVEEIEDNGWNISEADLKGALKNEQADKKKANKKSKISEADAKDYQLIRAMDLVKALYLYGQNDNLNVQTKQTEKTAGKGKK